VRCASHYPGDSGFKMFPVLPRHADPKMKNLIPDLSVKEEDLTKLQKSLLCIEE